MKLTDIARLRLHSQRLSGTTETKCSRPSEVVASLGAVQAQDYAGAKWALGLRLRSVTDADIERAFTDGTLLRTHVLRPTWHVVAAEDVRWLLDLTAPRVHATNAYMYRKLELDDALFVRSNAAIAKALAGGGQLTRSELASALKHVGIIADGMRLSYVMMRAELGAVVCSGARRGGQFTYALLEERAPQAKTLERDEAVAELAKRYFCTRGPATLRDFAWWSGLSIVDAGRGAEGLEHERVGAQTYWFSASAPPAWGEPPTAKLVAQLLPNFDEYFIGFRDRSAILERVKAQIDTRNPALSAHLIVIGAQVVGGWKRTLKKDSVIVEVNPITSLTEAEGRAVADAAERYGAFLGLAVVLKGLKHR